MVEKRDDVVFHKIRVCVLTCMPTIFYTVLQIIEKRIIKKAFSSSWRSPGTGGLLEPIDAGTMVPKIVENHSTEVEEEYEFEVCMKRHMHTRSYEMI